MSPIEDDRVTANGKTVSDNFKAWFGNSKVVDATGAPLVAYHSTNDAFDAFDTNKTMDGAFWFTSNKSAALAAEVGASGCKYIMPVYLRIQKIAGWDEYDRLTFDELIAQGFDGVKLDDDFIVFDANNIKSAEKNSGLFDHLSASIFDGSPIHKSLEASSNFAKTAAPAAPTKPTEPIKTALWQQRSKKSGLTLQSLDIEFERTVNSSSSKQPDLENLRSLLARGANIDGFARNGVPLRHAVTKLSVPLIRFLVDAGANLHARIPSKTEGANREQPHFNVDTILHWAAYRSAQKRARDFEAMRHTEVMVELIASGAAYKTESSHGLQPVDLIDPKGPKLLKMALTYPLHAAVMLHNSGLCIRLLERGIDPDEKHARQTAWRLAELQHPECLAAMRSWQAKVAIDRMLNETAATKPGP